MALIQDIKPPMLRHVSTTSMVIELHRRGVSIKDIFGTYYQLDAIGDAQLTVEDVLLAGLEGEERTETF